MGRLYAHDEEPHTRLGRPRDGAGADAAPGLPEADFVIVGASYENDGHVGTGSRDGGGPGLGRHDMDSRRCGRAAGSGERWGEEAVT